MVKIENMVQNGNTVTLDCFEEGDRTRSHHVVFDVETFKIKNDATNNIYVRQSIAKAWDYIAAGKALPREEFSYWC